MFKEQLCCRTYLFYSTKAHTWCQEVMEDKMQLLQLFNKCVLLQCRCRTALHQLCKCVCARVFSDLTALYDTSRCLLFGFCRTLKQLKLWVAPAGRH